LDKEGVDMRRERLSWALGWTSLGIGLTELSFAEDLSRVLGVSRRRAGLFRVLGLRELASGWALLRQPHRPEWVWARVAGDVMDLALLAVTFRKPQAHRFWRGTLTAVVAGATLVDLLSAVKHSQLSAQAGTSSLGMEAGRGAPLESWRGSGLAEDVGTPGASGDGESLSDETRQRMMDEAARKLGLPELH
jgi:hypothetical protein